MRQLVPLALVLLLSCQACAQEVYVAEIDGVIDAGTERYVMRAIDEAGSSKADLLLIEINSNSGYIKPTRRIVAGILGSRTLVATYCPDKSGGAFSASAYVYMAGNLTAMHPGAYLGAAQPSSKDNRSLEDYREYMVALARIGQRNISLASEFVTADRYIDAVSAVEQNMVYFTPETEDSLLSQIGLTNAKITRVTPNLEESLLSMLTNPDLIALFLLLGCFSALYAYHTRKLVLAIVPLLCLALSYWGMSTISFSSFSLMLLFLGILLVSLEAMHTRLSILAVGGGLCIAVGLSVLSAEPFHHPSGLSHLLVFVSSMALVVAAVVVAHIIGRERSERHHSLAAGLVGKKARVVQELRRNGLVRIEDKVWSAYSIVEERIPVDAVVEVVRLDGKVLSVVREGGSRTKHGHGHGGHGHGDHDAHVDSHVAQESHDTHESPHTAHEGHDHGKEEGHH